MGCLYFADLPTSALKQGLLQGHIHTEQFQPQQQELQLFRQEAASCSTDLGILFQPSTSLSQLLAKRLPQGLTLLPSSMVFMVTDCFAISTSTSKISPSELCSLIEGIYKRRTVISTQYSDVTSSVDSKMCITCTAEIVSPQQQIAQCHLRCTQWEFIHSCINSPKFINPHT